MKREFKKSDLICKHCKECLTNKGVTVYSKCVEVRDKYLVMDDGQAEFDKQETNGYNREILCNNCNKHVTEYQRELLGL